MDFLMHPKIVAFHKPVYVIYQVINNRAQKFLTSHSCVALLALFLFPDRIILFLVALRWQLNVLHRAALTGKEFFVSITLRSVTGGWLLLIPLLLLINLCMMH